MPSPYSTQCSIDKFKNLAVEIYTTFSYEYQPKMWMRHEAESRIRSTARRILENDGLSYSEKYSYLILLMNKIATKSKNKKTSSQAEKILQKYVLNSTDIDNIVEKIVGNDKHNSIKIKLVLISEYQREAIKEFEVLLSKTSSYLLYLKRYNLEPDMSGPKSGIRSKL